MMTNEELNEQLSPYVTISISQFEKLQWYVSELLKWNRKINLTSIIDIDTCWEKHIVDSLLASCFMEGCERVLDVGSGAGFPSIPLAIAFEELRVDSVDSVSKKIRFQRHCVRQLNIENFTTHAERIESLMDGMAGRFDIVVSRAFTSLDQFIEVALPFLKPNGKILAMKSAGVDKEILIASDRLKENGLSIVRRKDLVLSPSLSKRVLVEIGKMG